LRNIPTSKTLWRFGLTDADQHPNLIMWKSVPHDETVA
jgi:hypothetical protein